MESGLTSPTEAFQYLLVLTAASCTPRGCTPTTSRARRIPSTVHSVIETYASTSPTHLDADRQRIQTIRNIRLGPVLRSVYNPSFQSFELCRRHQSQWQATHDKYTHHKALIPSKHNDQLDRQELSERPPGLQLVLRQAVEHEEAVEGYAGMGVGKHGFITEKER